MELELKQLTCNLRCLSTKKQLCFSIVLTRRERYQCYTYSIYECRARVTIAVEKLLRRRRRKKMRRVDESVEYFWRQS